MCGRYASSRRPEDLVEEFEIDADTVAATVGEPLAPDYNVAPTKEVYAVLQRPPRAPEVSAVPGPPAEATRQLRVVRWGLVPFWAKDPSVGSRMINARVETVATKPAYRRAFATRRCLVPADGYYEWYPTSKLTKAGKPVKQPYFIHHADGSVLAMAGLYEIWRDPTRDETDPQRFRWTCTVLTTTATDDLGHIHDRMPMLVERERYSRWLDPSPRDDQELLALLTPAAPGRLAAYPVATLVNNVANNGPELLEPIPIEDQGAP